MILRLSLIALLMLPFSAFSELTKEDIASIRSIVKEEVTASEKRVREIVKEEVTASEKRMREYVDLEFQVVDTKIDEVNRRLNHQQTLIFALLAFIAVVITAPYAILTYHGKKLGQFSAELNIMDSKVEMLLHSQEQSLQPHQSGD